MNAPEPANRLSRLSMHSEPANGDRDSLGGFWIALDLSQSTKRFAKAETL